MEKQNTSMQISTLKDFLQSDKRDIQSIKNVVTLQTFVHCILDPEFIIRFGHKLKFFQAFKFAILQSLQTENQSQLKEHGQETQKGEKKSRVGLSNILCCFTLLVQRGIVFLQNQNQWKHFIELLLKIILGSTYSISLSYETKYQLFNEFIDTITNTKLNSIRSSDESLQKSEGTQINSSLAEESNGDEVNEMVGFISGLKSSGIFRSLFRSCIYSDQYHSLFQLCFIFMFHSHSRGVQDNKEDNQTVENFINQLFLQQNISQEKTEFFFILLKRSSNFHASALNPSMLNLSLKIYTLILINKVNSLMKTPESLQKKAIQQIDEIKLNIKSILSEFQKQQFSTKKQKTDFQKQISMMNLQFLLKSNALLGKDFAYCVKDKLQNELSDNTLHKLFEVLNFSSKILEPRSLFTYCQSIMSYINLTLQRLKLHPTKTLSFINENSYFSLSVSSECELNIQLKVEKSKENLVLFEFVSKSKKIEIVQKVIDSKLVKFCCLQYSKNEVKSKESEELFDFSRVQEFRITFEKLKLKLDVVRQVKQVNQSVRLFEFQKYESIGSKVNIGSSEGEIRHSNNIIQIHKLILVTKSAKKESEKTNIMKIAMQILEKNKSGLKNNDSKMYGFKMNFLSVKNFPNNINAFAESNNIKPLLLNTLHLLFDGYLSDLRAQKNLNLNQTVRQFFWLLNKIEQLKISADEILQVLLKTFLEKQSSQSEGQQAKQSMFNLALRMIELIQSYLNASQQGKNSNLVMRFISSISSCSVSLFLLSIQFLQQYLFKPHEKLTNECFDLLRILIFQAALLISDLKIFKKQKTLIIEATDHLLRTFQQFLSTKKLNAEQISYVEQKLMFLMTLLKNDKYENDLHEKMRRFKFSYIVINFLKSCFNSFSFNAETKQELLQSSLQICIKKIQYLKELILKDKNADRTQSVNYSAKKSAQNLIFANQMEDTREEQLKSSTKEHQDIQTRQAFQDKIYLLSSYLDLYFTIVLRSGNISISKFYSSLQILLDEINPQQIESSSVFYSQLISKCWTYFLKMFQNLYLTLTDNLIYLQAQPILQLLDSFGFYFVKQNTLIKIANSMVFYPQLLYSTYLYKKIQKRLNELRESQPLWLAKLISDLIKKSDQLSTELKSNVQKCLTFYLVKTPIIPSFIYKVEIQSLSQIFQSKSLTIILQLFLMAQELSSNDSESISNNLKCRQFLQQVKLFIKNLESAEQRNQNKEYLEKQEKYLSKIDKSRLHIILQSLSQHQQKYEKDSSLEFDLSLLQITSICEVLKQYLENIVEFYQVQMRDENRRISQRNSLQKEKQRVKSQKEEKLKAQVRKDVKQLVQKGGKSEIQRKLKVNINPNRQKRVQPKNTQILRSPQIYRNTQIYRSPQPRSLVSEQLNRKRGKKVSEQRSFLNHIQNLLSRIQFVQEILSQRQASKLISFKEDKVFFNWKSINQLQLLYRNGQFTIDEYCDTTGLKPLMKRKYIQNNFPRMKERTDKQETKQVSNKINFKSLCQHLKIIKSNAQIYQNKLISINSEQKSLPKKIYDAMPMSPTFRAKERQVGQYVDSFKVTLITSSQFYQGELRVYNYYRCEFVENKDVNLQVYGQLQALESQQRKKAQIQRKPVAFQIKFDKSDSEYIKRSYLKVDNSIQIFACNRSYFFVFRAQKQRDSFTTKINQKAGLNPQNIEIYSKIWQKGIISNFEYLMHLNKYSDRSFNDISQYYVFPWTVTEYKSAQMDGQFMKTANNYRDLSKPIGKINDDKFGKIKAQFENSKRFFDPNRPHFMYGSFYSNPAIVSYYLIRLHPFSAHQYELQNYKFDNPDRLFGSIEENFQAVYRVPGDFKELIPEFYCNPYFLRNRNQYDFGMTQSKKMIDDVELPRWVKTQTPEQFIFRMRKSLQSSYVTQNLHKWIDLTFGIAAARTKAQKHDNLYNQSIYGLNLQKNSLAFCNKYLKQFGQLPRTIFQSQHPKNLMHTPDKKKMLKKSKSLTDMLREQLMKQDIKQYTYNECQKLRNQTETSFNKLNSKESIKEQKGKVQNKESFMSVKSTNPIEVDEQMDSDAFLMLRQNCLIVKNRVGMGYYVFSEDNKDPIEYKNKPQLNMVQKCQFITIDDSRTQETYFLTIQNNSLYGHKFVNKLIRGWKSSIGDKFIIETREPVKLVKSIGSYLIVVTLSQEIQFYTTKLASTDKKAMQRQQPVRMKDSIKIENFTLNHLKTLKPQFEQVIDIYTISYLSLMCVRNSFNQFYVFDVREDYSINFRCKFMMGLMFDEKIRQVLSHNMGYFLVVTNKSRVVLVNLLGEMILNFLVSFERSQVQRQVESILSVCFWSQDSSEIVFSTSKGVLYKTDIFDMAERRTPSQDNVQKDKNLDINKGIPVDEFEIYSESGSDVVESYELMEGKQRMIDIKMDRRGRHWKLYGLGSRGNIYTLKNKYFDITKCMKIVLRERQD